jgi:VPDSG-CTERM motif
VSPLAGGTLKIHQVMKTRILVLAVTFALSLTVQSKAAFINIDDSDVNNITLTAGDFEGGFYVDGILLTTGVGYSGSITFSDTADGQYTGFPFHSFSGRWIDLSQTGTLPVYSADLFGAGGNTFSYFERNTQSLTSFGNIVGYYAAYNGTSHFSTSNPLSAQDGHTEYGGVPFLSWSFKSESAESVPDTSATLALLGASFLGLAAQRRRFVA